MHRGDFAHVTSVRVFQANKTLSQKEDEGLFCIDYTKKNVKLTSHNGLIEKIQSNQENTTKAIRFNLHYYLSSEEGIRILSEEVLKESNMFTMRTTSILSDEISEYLNTFGFNVSSLTNPSTKTSTLCILVQVHTFHIKEQTKDGSYLNGDNLTNLKAALVEQTRLDEPRVEFAEEIGTLFEVKVTECDDDDLNCSICLENLVMGVEVVKTPNCMHIFHRDCLIQWLSKSSTCPMCRGNCTIII